MQLPFTKRAVAAVLIVAALSVGVFVALRNFGAPDSAGTELSDFSPEYRVIGLSVQGRDIEAYTYGNGEQHLVFVGGIHGGYEWNSVLLAYTFMDYLDIHPEILPENLMVTVIPAANPDGLYKVVGVEGRFTEADVSASQAIQVAG